MVLEDLSQVLGRPRTCPAPLRDTNRKDVILGDTGLTEVSSGGFDTW